MNAASPSPPQSEGIFTRKLPPLLLWLLGINVVIELALMAGDMGLLGINLRAYAYGFGAFWSGLLRGGEPLYATQPVVMFLTHAFLHGGILHLAMNMLALVVLGQRLLARMTPAAFLALYIASAVGGGLAFGLISDSARPMVGASGALFGLLGALEYRVWRTMRRGNMSMQPFWRSIGELVLLNALLWLVLGGGLAWEAHLGGFLAGWLAAVLGRRYWGWR